GLFSSGRDGPSGPVAGHVPDLDRFGLVTRRGPGETVQGLYGPARWSAHPGDLIERRVDGLGAPGEVDGGDRGDRLERGAGQRDRPAAGIEEGRLPRQDGGPGEMAPGKGGEADLPRLRDEGAGGAGLADLPRGLDQLADQAIIVRDV